MSWRDVDKMERALRGYLAVYHSKGELDRYKTLAGPKYSDWLDFVESAESLQELKEATRSDYKEKVEYREFPPEPKDLAILIASFENSGGGAIIVSVGNKKQLADLRSNFSKATSITSSEKAASLFFRTTRDGRTLGVVTVSAVTPGVVAASVDGIIYERVDSDVVPITPERMHEIIRMAASVQQSGEDDYLQSLAKLIASYNKDALSCVNWRNKSIELFLSASLGAVVSFLFTQFVVPALI
jgi:hypothetical protein